MLTAQKMLEQRLLEEDAACPTGKKVKGQFGYEGADGKVVTEECVFLRLCVPIKWTDEQIVEHANTTVIPDNPKGWALYGPCAPEDIPKFKRRCNHKKGYMHVHLKS